MTGSQDSPTHHCIHLQSGCVQFINDKWFHFAQKITFLPFLIHTRGKRARFAFINEHFQLLISEELLLAFVASFRYLIFKLIYTNLHTYLKACKGGDRCSHLCTRAQSRCAWLQVCTQAANSCGHKRCVQGCVCFCDGPSAPFICWLILRSLTLLQQCIPVRGLWTRISLFWSFRSYHTSSQTTQQFLPTKKAHKKTKTWWASHQCHWPELLLLSSISSYYIS